MKKNTNRMQLVLNAWETLASDQTFGDMTLTEFKTQVKALDDLREQRESLGEETLAMNRRVKDLTRDTFSVAQRVVFGVKSHPAHGDNSPLYAAMGYVRKSERRTGLTRRSKVTALQQISKAA